MYTNRKGGPETRLFLLNHLFRISDSTPFMNVSG